ncbi:hypothetical protein GCM10009584_01960 [Ornithinimicrobium humiphilum]|uniref:Uncharacterized protein n=1 Tax=Ornithinimicrobium humiphilum TaxID=125288 RepID=A0A543KRR6_9MICO|nr:hypothetical protein [Ornithinimicrobium humiphilum]TQM97759.1 hypothetical protein FB476_2684 [Ornithinimicrobium humiphilum]
MHVLGAGSPPSPGPAAGTGLLEAWDIATVVVEFDVVGHEQAAEVAQLLFAVDDVLTVRVGGPGDRSVYRVDVPRGDPGARERGAEPALRAARALDIGLRLVRIGITADGLGDPEGEPPPAEALPWARRLP